MQYSPTKIQDCSYLKYTQWQEQSAFLLTCALAMLLWMNHLPPGHICPLWGQPHGMGKWTDSSQHHLVPEANNAGAKPLWSPISESNTMCTDGSSWGWKKGLHALSTLWGRHLPSCASASCLCCPLRGPSSPLDSRKRVLALYNDLWPRRHPSIWNLVLRGHMWEWSLKLS
jgi:hypothetical protein